VETGDVRASSFLFQRISVAVQFNSVLLHDGFVGDDQPKYSAHAKQFVYFL